MTNLMTTLRASLVGAVLLVALSLPAVAATIEDVVTIADRARGGSLPGVSWTVHVDSRYGDGSSNSQTLEVEAVRTDWAATTTAPGNIRGQRLVKRGTNMWFSKPNLRKPVPISLRQRLTGAASNGDVASTNYIRDYHIERLPDQTVSGIDCYVVHLTKKNNNVTYDQIKYWIAKDRNLGVAANFYTNSGRLLKSATFRYDNSIYVDGQQRPFVSRMTIRDAINSGDVTTLSYIDPQVGDIPASDLRP